ncbi:MAG: hypothetical protein MJ105_01000 [Lachnospiraceae bacterium]|nr:hypothetical protein [Lachnospiraceae bacterium]
MKKWIIHKWKVLKSTFINKILVPRYLKRKANDEVLKKIELSSCVFVTIAFNNAELIKRQIENLLENCEGTYLHLIVDNSNKKMDGEIEDVCNMHSHVVYVRQPSAMKLGAYDHSVALNWACYQILEKVHINNLKIVFLDHDIFLMKKIEFESIFHGGQKVWGYSCRHEPQKKGWYLWPGLFAIDCTQFESKVHFDFMSSQLYGDTGSMNYETIFCKLNKSELAFSDRKNLRIMPGEKALENDNQKNLVQIFDDTWMHIIGGSNWAKSENFDEKLKRAFALIEANDVEPD